MAASLLLPFLSGCQHVHNKQETGENSFLRNPSVFSVQMPGHCHHISIAFKLSLPGIAGRDGTWEAPL